MVRRSCVRAFVRSCVCSCVCSCVRLHSVRFGQLFTLTVHINALYNESVHQQEQHTSGINTIPKKIATLLPLEVVSIKLGSLVSVRCRHRSAKSRGCNFFLSMLRAWAVLNCLIWWVITYS